MVAILLIVLFGYGTAVQAIQYPDATDPVIIVKGIIYRPLFQIYGELFLDEITGRERVLAFLRCVTTEKRCLRGDNCMRLAHRP